MELELLQILGISLGLGLLVGLQRQHDQARIAGIRTFPLITLFGTITALLAQAFGGWIVGAGAVAVTAMVVSANMMQRDDTRSIDVGQTTEAAVLLMYAVGAYLVLGQIAVAVAVGGATAVLLHLKETLHLAVAHMGEKDLKAIMQFVVISFIILPILPDQNFGPYGVLNLYNIWLMVVLIVGIGLSGYFAYKLLGSKAGTLLAGILGGLISSTATTVTYAKRSKGTQKNNLLALVIFIATIVSLVRILVEIAVVTPQSFAQIAPPILALLVVMILLAIVIYSIKKGNSDEMPEQENPAQLKTALVFGAIYGAVILATAAAKDYFGTGGLYIVAILSGLTDVDAITLSTSRLLNQQTLDVTTGWKVILIAALSNIAFKGALAGILGNRSLFFRIALLFGISLAAGILIIWWWPADFSFNFLKLST